MARRRRWFRLGRKPKSDSELVDASDDDDDDDDPLAADSEYRHEIAHDYGTYPSGEPLPRHTDKHGRVWVTCNCGKEFLLKSQPPTALPTLEQDIAGAIVEALSDEDS